MHLCFMHSSDPSVQLFMLLSLPKFRLRSFKRIQFTMVGFENSCPKTQARNLAPAGAILFQFLKFQNLVHDPQCFEPWKQEFLEKE